MRRRDRLVGRLDMGAVQPVSRADGKVEDIELARTYLRNELGARYDAVKVDAFLAAGPQMVDFFQSRTELKFVSGSWIADIHGGTPGAGTGGRSVAPKPLDGRKLGPTLLAKARRQKYETSLFGMGVMAGPDLYHFVHATRSARSFAYAGGRVIRHALDMLFFGRGMRFVNGAALVGRLMKSAHKLGVALWVSSPATRLVVDDGKVRGAQVETTQGTVTVNARRGVVLATGGFAHDAARRAELFARTSTATHDYGLPPQSVAGDGLRLGESAGGQVDRSLASPVAWCPVSIVPYRNGSSGLYPHIIDRGKPGIIGVLADGRRFVNEADGYHDYVSAMLEGHPARC